MWGKNIEDHGHTLKQVLKRAEENDLTIDSTSGFYQIKLVKESTWLTTFNTPFGHLVWYQPQSFFKGPCLRCLRTVIVDDLLVWGKNIEDHGHTLKQVLKRAEENDLRFN